jgi:hypothetical protein
MDWGRDRVRLSRNVPNRAIQGASTVLINSVRCIALEYEKNKMRTRSRLHGFKMRENRLNMPIIDMQIYSKGHRYAHHLWIEDAIASACLKIFKTHMQMKQFMERHSDAVKSKKGTHFGWDVWCRCPGA